MKKTILVIMLLIISVLCLPNTVFAHGGKTDGAGGHYDHHNGEYHYHHGYPAHSHTNGMCPYDFDDKTDHNTNKYNSNYFYNDKTSTSEKEDNLSLSIWSIVSQIIITILESIVIFFIGCFLMMWICNFIPNTSDKVLIIFAIIIGILSIILAATIDVF